MNPIVAVALSVVQAAARGPLEAIPESAMSTEPALSNWFIIYIIFMSTAAFLGILFLVLVLSVKLSRISKQLDEISGSASTFIRIGLDHFKERTGKRKERTGKRTDKHT